jgi:hypothetical protein
VVACGHFSSIYVVDAIVFRVVRVFEGSGLNWHRVGCLFSFTNDEGSIGEGFMSMCMDGNVETYSLRRSNKSESQSKSVSSTFP